MPIITTIIIIIIAAAHLSLPEGVVLTEHGQASALCHQVDGLRRRECRAEPHKRDGMRAVWIGAAANTVHGGQQQS